MTKKNQTLLSKKISLTLRHAPEEFGLILDEYGWASVLELITALQIDVTTLEEIVSSSDKQRFRFNDDRTKIKANQGHSITIKNDMEPIIPPAKLYHGTNSHVVEIIQKEGLKPMARQHVHLSHDQKTAQTVGNRRSGKTIILEIDALAMHQAGFIMYQSQNGVYLTDAVPPQFISEV